MKKRTLITATSLLLIHSLSSALTLDEFLGEVQKRNKAFQSYNVSKDAAEDRREAGDLGLTPVLTMGANYLSDEAQPNASGGTKLVARQYTLGVAKEFSSGTQAAVTAVAQQSNIDNPPVAALGSYANSGLGFSVSQSLWKNAFGHGTWLRQQRETTTAALETESYNLQQRQTLIEAEGIYWDHLYVIEELKLRQASLERAKKIENWLRRRFADGINDKADYLNAQALVASRELLLVQAKDQTIATEQRVRDVLEMGPGEKTPALTSDFTKPRNITAMVTGDQGRVLRLDSYLAVLEAKAKDIGAREAQDALRPDLVLQGAYNTNSGIQADLSSGLNRISDSYLPTTQVGLKLTYLFDSDAKLSKEALARKEALASKLLSERKLLESESSWTELQRRYGVVLQQIETADKLSKIQTNRAKEQALKLSRGRALTSDVINSEEDAATAELNVNRLRGEARKMEAQGRLFIRINE